MYNSLFSYHNPGAPKARAQELINALTESVYQHVELSMFEEHVELFGLLVTLERMRMSQQLTNQELGLFVNGVDTLQIEDAIVFDNKPAWISTKVSACQMELYFTKSLNGHPLKKVPVKWKCDNKSRGTHGLNRRFWANRSSEPTKFLSCKTQSALLTKELLVIWCPC